MKVVREFTSPKLNDNYRLIYAGNCIERFETKEEAEARLLEEDDEDIESKFVLSDTYEANNYAVYKGEKGNIIILFTYNFEDDEPPYETDKLIDFVCNRLSDKLNDSTSIVLEVSQCYGTSLDHVFVFDDDFYNEVANAKYAVEILGAFRKYVSTHRQNSNGGYYKYERIVNGKYSECI